MESPESKYELGNLLELVVEDIEKYAALIANGVADALKERFKA